MLFSNFYLPIELIKTTNKEYVMEQVTYTEEELIEILTKRLKNELLQETPDKNNIVNINVNTNSGNGYVEVEVTCEVLEKIGIKQMINI